MARGVNTKANGIDFRANRFDEFLKLIPQNLTDAEKAQVMANLGITPTPGSLDGAVRYDAAQTLTDKKKEIARENIDAMQLHHIEYVEQEASEIFIGKYLSSNGSLISATDFTTKSFSVQSEKKYLISGSTGTGTGSRIIAWYDENDALISVDGAGARTDWNRITKYAPSGAVKINVQQFSAGVSIKLVEISASTDTNLERINSAVTHIGNLSNLTTAAKDNLVNSVNEINSKANANQGVINGLTEERSPNLYNGTTIAGVISTLGSIYNIGTISKSTDKIEVLPNAFYYLSGRNGDIESIRCINADNTVSKVRVASTGEEPASGIHFYLT